MSLLSIVQEAAIIVRQETPSAVISSSVEAVKLLKRLADVEGRELSRRHNWQALTSEHSFSTVAASAQTSSVPTDFGWIIPDTMFNRTTNRKVFGPLSSQEWQEIQSSLVTRVDPAFRIRGGTILITPTPSAGESIYYEYISKNWCQSSGGSPQATWAADDDTGVLDEYLIMLGVVWRFKQTSGLDYSEEFQSYERAVADAIQRDGSRRVLSSGVASRERIPYPPQVPETLTGLS